MKDIRADIIVFGSGAAGLAASVTAARAGAEVLLLDASDEFGGTLVHSGLRTLCGLFDWNGRFINGGFAEELAGAVGHDEPVKMGRVWVLYYSRTAVAAFRDALLLKTKSLHVRRRCPVVSVEVAGCRIARINGIRVGAVIDCTGTAEVARVAGVPCLQTDERTQATSVLFALDGVDHNVKVGRGLLSAMMSVARARFPALHLMHDEGTSHCLAKFAGRVDLVPALVDFLRANCAGFAHCQIIGSVTEGHRAGRMIEGEYVLTGSDVLGGRKFSDAVARCCWPIEQWSAKGVCKFRYPPEDAYYEIPARSLRAASTHNLFMAGKTISADVDAIASARVMGCCLATGEAAAKLALASLKEAA